MIPWVVQGGFDRPSFGFCECDGVGFSWMGGDISGHICDRTLSWMDG